MKYLEGLIEWESDGLKGIPTNLLEEYIVDLQCELENRKYVTPIKHFMDDNGNWIIEFNKADIKKLINKFKVKKKN
jgi:hypothetical protein